jgi:hypothetical protein
VVVVVVAVVAEEAVVAEAVPPAVLAAVQEVGLMVQRAWAPLDVRLEVLLIP